MKINKKKNPGWLFLMVTAVSVLFLGDSYGWNTSFKPEAPAPEELTFTPLTLPEDGLHSLEELCREERGVPVQTIQTLTREKSTEKGLLTLQDVPFLLNPESRVVLLGPDNPGYTLPVGDTLDVLYFLFTIIGDYEKEPLFACRIFREDGFTIRISWETGRNIGPGVGAWEPDINPKAERPATTTVFWEGKDPDGVPVRLFGSVWVNDNPWYAVNRIQWDQVHPETRILLLAVSAGSYR
jgi:hypothetical protein